MEQLSKLQKKESINKPLAKDVFAEYSYYLDARNLFIYYFNVIPNYTYELDIDCKKALKYFFDTYKSDIKDCHFNKRYSGDSRTSQLNSIYFILYEDLIVEMNLSSYCVYFLFRLTDTAKVLLVINGIKQHKKKYNKSEIFLIVKVADKYETKALSISKHKLKISDNYNDDFKEVHQTILKRLSKNNDKGLVLLHGKPGTGKTSYIRYLIASLKKEVIFLPPDMASSLTNSNLMNLLIETPNSVFVIEDAENIVIDRERNGASPVSALLNISDGLLSDCLNIQIICSFNTDISKVDSALLRKGRLIAQYEFKELDIIKAQSLSYKMGFDCIITRPMTLTEIYNQDERDFTAQIQRKSIGFVSA